MSPQQNRKRTEGEQLLIYDNAKGENYRMFILRTNQGLHYLDGTKHWFVGITSKILVCIIFRTLFFACLESQPSCTMYTCFTARYPANIYLFKVNNRNTRKRCEICSKLRIKTPERRFWRRSGVSIVNFKHISHLFLLFLLLTLSK